MLMDGIEGGLLVRKEWKEEEWRERNLITWNSMIGGYVKWEEGVEFDRWLSEIG